MKPTITVPSAPFTSVSPYEIENACRLIGKDWMLITAGDPPYTAEVGEEARATRSTLSGSSTSASAEVGEEARATALASSMTASWGCMGILWNKPVAVVFIRPQRHTYTLTETHDRLSLAFFDESYREALRYFGTKSGRDGDKFAATGLTRACHPTLGTPYPAQARLVLFCRKLYVDDLKKANFLDPAMLAHYEANDFHRFYVCEIEEAWQR